MTRAPAVWHTLSWGTRIRTLISGARIRCPAVRRSPKGAKRLRKMPRGSRPWGGANIFPPATLSSSHEAERHLELMRGQGKGDRRRDDQGVVRDGYPLTA